MAITVDIIDQKFEDHKKYLELQFNTVNNTLKEVKDRVDKTNGRVKKLEIWRATLIGAWMVVTILLIPVVVSYAKDFFLQDRNYSLLDIK